MLSFIWRTIFTNAQVNDVNSRISEHVKYTNKISENEASKILLESARELGLAPKTEEITKRIYGGTLTSVALMTIYARFGKLCLYTHDEYPYVFGLFINDIYTVGCNLACLLDPRGIDNSEFFFRCCDFLRIPSIWTLLFLKLDFKEAFGYKEIMINYPVLHNLNFVYWISLATIVDASRTSNSKLGSSGPQYSDIETTVKDSIAYRKMSKLEEKAFIGLMKKHPALLAFSDPYYRKETRKPGTPPVYYQLTHMGEEAVEKLAEQRWKEWEERNRSEDYKTPMDTKKSDTIKMDFKIFNIWKLKTEILTILKLIEIIPVIGPKKKLIEKFLLQKLQ